MADTTLQISIALATLKIGSPLGDLAALPREIRDQIYCNLVTSTKIRAYYSDTVVKPWLKNQQNSWGRVREQHCIVAVLRTSKAIKDEILQALYSNGTFRFDELVDFDNIARFKTPCNDITNRMMNIEICFCLWPGCGH